MKKVITALRAGVRIFLKNNCLTSAAAISFYAFFSLMPLMLLITASLGFIFGTRPWILERVIRMVQDALPVGDQVINDLKGLSVRWKAYGWIGLLFLISSAELVMGATLSALRMIFRTKDKDGFFKRKLVNLLVLLLAIMASFLSVTLTILSFVFRKSKIKLLGPVISYLIGGFAFRYLIPFLLVVAVVAVVYMITSRENLSMGYALLGSLIFATLWEAAKQLFTWYISMFPTYNKFYGSLGALMILLIWIFYSANIFLFSASVAKAAFDRRL